MIYCRLFQYKIIPYHLSNDTKTWWIIFEASAVDYYFIESILFRIFIFTFSPYILQEYSVQITFREDWIDPRLTYNDFNGKIIRKNGISHY